MVAKESFNLAVYLSTSPKQTVMRMGLVPPGYFSCTFGNGYLEISLQYQCCDHVFHTQNQEKLCICYWRTILNPNVIQWSPSMT